MPSTFPHSKRGATASPATSPPDVTHILNARPATAAPTSASVDADGFTKILTKEERRKLRKVERKKPQFQFDMQYYRNGKKVGIAHIRDLSVYIVTGEGQKPSWIVPDHRASIDHTLMLFIPGLLPQHLGIPDIPQNATLPFPINPAMIQLPSSTVLPPDQLPVLSKMFTYGLPTRAPGDNRRLHSVMSNLMSVPLPDGLRRKKEEESRKLAAMAKADNAPPLLYLLTPNQMIENDYRLPSYITESDSIPISLNAREGLSDDLKLLLAEKSAASKSDLVLEVTPAEPLPLMSSSNGDKNDDGWIEVGQADGPPGDGKWKVLAIDCEMVLTEKGSELARISVIDYETGKDIYDELVKPTYPVVDYRTKWSGMTQAKLSKATHTLSSIQAELVTSPNALITPHTILLGHSLECDLTALKIKHSLCLDTAVMYRHPRGAPYKPALKWLAQKWLGKEIQSQEGGHDSAEDAMTCVELLRLKMANGPDFGTFMDTSESLFEKMGRFGPDPRKPGKKTLVCDYMNIKSGPTSKATTAVRCSSDEEVVDGIIKNIENHDFAFGRMMELANVQGWNGDAFGSRKDKQKEKDTAPAPAEGESPETDDVEVDEEEADDKSKDLSTALESLNTRLTKLYSALPKHTALIILTGHGNPLPMLALANRRAKWERMVKTLGGTDGISGEDRWLAEDDRKLEQAVGEAREGMAFFCIKV